MQFNLHVYLMICECLWSEEEGRWIVSTLLTTLG